MSADKFQVNLEERIQLNKFKPRAYQLPLIRAFESQGYTRALLVWPRRCLSGNTHILLPNGSYKLLKDLSVGDAILSWDGTQFVTDTIKNKWSTGVKYTKLVRGTSSFLPITTSEDHVFAMTHGGYNNYKWKPIGQFNKHNLVLNYAGIQTGTVSQPDMAEFLGYMLSDGYISAYQQPKFTNTNIEILKRVAELAQKLFNCSVIWRPKGSGFDLSFTNGTNGGGATFNPIKELFRQYGLDIPKSKRRLFPFMWDYTEESILRFLAAYISGDGNIYCHTKGFTASDSQHVIPPAIDITLNCGVSYNMAWDIYWLLRKISIVPQVPSCEKGSNWKIKIAKNWAVKKLLSIPVYGKTQKQDEALSKLPLNPKRYKITDGCYRSAVTVIDSEQEELFDIETTTHGNFIANGYVVHNSGKDILAFNFCIRSLLRRVGAIYYIFPTYSQGKKVLWDGLNNEGQRILDYIPKTLVESMNSTEMKIKLKNGSLFQVVGSENYNSLMGTNPMGVVLSEYALQDPAAYQYIRPILMANGGWVIFISTPRGKNHLYNIYQTASNNPESWYCSKLTVEDTGHVSLEDIQREIDEGTMSEDLVQQEFYCSFDLGVEGAYYTKYLDRMRLNGQIGSVPWEPGFKVHTCWDLGVRDSTCIIFYQIIGQTIHIIDCYEGKDVGLDHYIKVVQQKPYVYGKHFAPHDIGVREFTSGLARVDIARNMGVNFTIVPKLSIQDGIEAVRSKLNKMWIDEFQCKNLIKALESYRKEYDSKLMIYKENPLHDWASHWADSVRYLVLSLGKTGDGTTPEELNRRYEEARFGRTRDSDDFFSGQHDTFGGWK